MPIISYPLRLAAWRLLPIACLLLSGCAYRFSNTGLKTPNGIQSIAVEGIYDISREVFPHEFLWSAVQNEVARRGRLELTSQEEADALMVVTIKKALISPAGTPSKEQFAKDPVVTDTDKGNPNNFRNLRTAGSWTTDEAIQVTVFVEVFDLNNRAVLFQKEYLDSGVFKSLMPNTITPTSSVFPQYEEALQANAKAISQRLASRIVNDFLR